MIKYIILLTLVLLLQGCAPAASEFNTYPAVEQHFIVVFSAMHSERISAVYCNSKPLDIETTGYLYHMTCWNGNTWQTDGWGKPQLVAEVKVFEGDVLGWGLVE